MVLDHDLDGRRSIFDVHVGPRTTGEFERGGQSNGRRNCSDLPKRHRLLRYALLVSVNFRTFCLLVEIVNQDAQFISQTLDEDLSSAILRTD
jgi:hypothetical protein